MSFTSSSGSRPSAIVPVPSAEQDIFEVQAPAPLDVFYSRVLHPENIALEQRARDAKLLSKAQHKQITKQMRQLEKQLRQKGYLRNRGQLEVLRERFLGTLALYRQSADPEQKAFLKAKLNTLLKQADTVKSAQAALAPDYRRYIALKRLLDDHTAAVAREKLHAELRKKMAQEVAIHAQTLIQTWSRLGYRHQYTFRGRTRTHHIRFESAVVTPDNIQYKIYTGRLGLFGGYVDTMPYGVSVKALLEPDVLIDLSVACHRQVTAHISKTNGAWVIVNRLGTIDGLLDLVFYRQVMPHYPEADRAFIPLCVGVAEGRQVHWVQLAKHPHLLIGGTTGNGKSNFINSVICTLISTYSPDELRLVLVDLKEGIEFADYDGIPHLLTDKVEEVGQFAEVLSQLEALRKERSEKLRSLMARDIYEYNARADDPLPLIVIIIDEFASIQSDRQQAKVIQNYIMQLTAKGRAVGMHIILCTQNPSVDILPGASKSNMPLRLAFAMPTTSASTTILGVGDAARLAPVKGRALVMLGSEMWQVQTPKMTHEDIERALNIARSHESKPITLPAPTGAARFGEHDLIKTALDYFDGRLGARPIFEFLKSEVDITHNALAEMVKRIVARGDIEFDGKRYRVAPFGKGHRLIENTPEIMPENS